MPPQTDARTLLCGSGGRPYRRCPAVPPLLGIACEPVDGTGRRPLALPEALLTHLAGGGRSGSPTSTGSRRGRHRRHRGRSGSRPPLYAALTQAGLPSLWCHQLEAAEAAHAGQHVVLSTGTASGKSLGYLLPALSDVVDGRWRRTGGARPRCTCRRPRRWPHDQLDRLDRLAVPGLRAATYDGDTSPGRAAVGPGPRELRPHQPRPAAPLPPAGARAVGAVPAGAALRRRRRVPRLPRASSGRTWRWCCGGCGGSRPVPLLPHLRAGLRHRRRPGRSTPRASSVCRSRAVTEDGSPRAALTFGLWEPGETGSGWRPEPLAPDSAADPALTPPASPLTSPASCRRPPASGSTPSRRRSAVAESADLLSDLVAQGVQTVAFARSRAGVEVISAAARSHLRELDVALGDTVAAYRGGYLPEERRELEAALRAGGLLGLAATNALELGIDVSGLDAVLLAGWPGTRASMWQQAGRAGRAGAESLAVLVAADDPLDTYLVHHPDAVFGGPVEAAVLDPENPYVLGPAPRRGCRRAAAHRGRRVLLRVVDACRCWMVWSASVSLRRRPTGWFWAEGDRPADQVSLRGSGEPRCASSSTAPAGCSARSTTPARTPRVHPGAVYVHQGDTYVVVSLDLDEGCALVRVGDPGWSTQARSMSRVRHRGRRPHAPVGTGRVSLRRGRGAHPGHLLPATAADRRGPRRAPARPARAARCRPRPCGGPCPPTLLARVGVDPRPTSPAPRTPPSTPPSGCSPSSRPPTGGTSAGSRPPCTRTPGCRRSSSTTGTREEPASPSAGSRRWSSWLAGTRAAIAGCACPAGCPSCVQSPKCGNGNEPLDKARAVTLLDLTLDGARSPR